MAAGDNRKQVAELKSLREKLNRAERKKDYPTMAEACLEIIALDARAKSLNIMVCLYHKDLGEAYLKLLEYEKAVASLKIARDGRVTVAIPQVETGQGIWTALPQIVADELGAAWETVAVEPAALTENYPNPLVGDGKMRITAGSTSVRAFEQPLRKAAAVARTMLVGAAADRWNISPSECEVADGFVINGARTLTFGELAEEAADRTPPRSQPLRQSTKGRLIGQALARLDGPAKADGSWRFATDVRLPNMLFAAVRMASPRYSTTSTLCQVPSQDTRSRRTTSA